VNFSLNSTNYPKFHEQQLKTYQAANCEPIFDKILLSFQSVEFEHIDIGSREANNTKDVNT